MENIISGSVKTKLKFRIGTIFLGVQFYRNKPSRICWNQDFFLRYDSVLFSDFNHSEFCRFSILVFGRFQFWNFLEIWLFFILIVIDFKILN